MFEVKPYRLFFLSCLMAGVMQLALPAEVSAARWALLIGISDYPDNGGWKDIHADNDLRIIREMLLNQGLDTANILVLRNQEATREGILKALRQTLYEKVRKGDLVYFHYSGHGQQVTDQDGDELDGYDEALVSWNSPRDFVAGMNEGQFLVRDDELGRLIDRIARKLGPRGMFWMVNDACHSGTSTRSMAAVRGCGITMGPPAKDRSQLSDDPDQEDWISGMEAQKAPVIAFFGSSAEQLNNETLDADGTYYGSLSYALVKALARCDRQETYGSLFSHVSQEMSRNVPRQRPEAFGEMDRIIFSGEWKPTPAFFRVLQWNHEEELLIQGGTAQDLDSGAVLRWVDRSNSNKAPVYGRIISAGMFSSLLKPDQPMDPAVKNTDWVLEKPAPRRALLGVNFRFSGSQGLSAWEEMARENSYRLQTGGVPDILVTDTLAGAPAVTFLDKSGAEIGRISLAGRSAETLVREAGAILDTFRRGFLFRQFRGVNPFVPLEVDLVYSTPGKGDPLKGADSIPQFRVGESVRVRLRNDGEKTIYFNLVDIQPGNKYMILFPLTGFGGGIYEPANLKLEANSTLTIPLDFTISEPFGLEMFKLIASDRPLDLRSAGRGTRGVQADPFAKEFLGDRPADVNMRGMDNRKNNPGRYFSAEFVFRIVP